MLNKLELPAASHSSGASGRDRKIFFASVIFLLAIALITRFFNLGVGALVGDEMITYQRSAERLWNFVNPLYYWLVEFSRLFFDRPEVLTRLPSALLSAISVPIFFLLWRRVIGEGAAFIGALVLVFLEWHLFQGQFGRFYSGVFLFSMLSYFFYWASLEKGSVSYLLLSVAAGVIAFLFHFTAIMVLATSLLFSGVFYFAASARRLDTVGLLEPNQTRMLKTHLILGGIGVLAMFPLALYVYGGWTAHEPGFSGWLVFLRRFLVAFGLGPIVLAGVGWLVLFQQNARFGLFVLLSTAVPIFLAVAGAQFIIVGQTYVFYTVPLLVLCCGVLIHHLMTATSGVLRVGILGVFLAPMLPAFVSHYTDRASLDVREVVAFVEQRLAEGDQVVEYAIEFREHAKGRLPVIQRPLPSLMGRGGAELSALGAFDGLTDEANRTWLVFGTQRRGLRPDVERWLLTNARLVWRKSAVRLDYSSRGYEVWVVEPRHFDERSYD